jgi:hypothetical protein
MWWIHMTLAAAPGFRGDVEEARASLNESLQLKPEMRSMAQLAAYLANRPWTTNPRYQALLEKTVHVGLRRAGVPEE